jgi:hypothetical protein
MYNNLMVRDMGDATAEDKVLGVSCVAGRCGPCPPLHLKVLCSEIIDSNWPLHFSFGAVAHEDDLIPQKAQMQTSKRVKTLEFVAEKPNKRGGWDEMATASTGRHVRSDQSQAKK